MLEGVKDHFNANITVTQKCRYNSKIEMEIVYIAQIWVDLRVFHPQLRSRQETL